MARWSTFLWFVVGRALRDQRAIIISGTGFSVLGYLHLVSSAMFWSSIFGSTNLHADCRWNSISVKYSRPVRLTAGEGHVI